MQLPASHQLGPKPSSAQNPGAKILLSLGQLSQVPSGLRGLTVQGEDASGPGPRSGMGWHKAFGATVWQLAPQDHQAVGGAHSRLRRWPLHPCVCCSLCLTRFWFTIHRNFVFMHLFSLALSVMFTSLYFSPSISPLHPPSVLS